MNIDVKSRRSLTDTVDVDIDLGFGIVPKDERKAYGNRHTPEQETK